MAEWWEDLRAGEPHLFGFMQIDIVSIAREPGLDASVQRAMATLRNQLSRVCSEYGLVPFAWERNSTRFTMLINQPESYDLIAQCSLHLLEKLSYFKEIRGSLGGAGCNVSVQICCHAGEAVFDREGSIVQRPEISEFLRDARGTGVPDSVVLTDTVHSQLTTDMLRREFELIDRKWQYEDKGRSRKAGLFVSPGPGAKEEREAREVEARKYELSHKEMIDLVARAFTKLGAKVTTDVIVQGMPVDLVLEEDMAAGKFITRVECKAYKTPVNIEIVQMYHGRFKLLEDIHAQRGTIVSLNGFTREALIVAQSVGINPVSFADLMERCGGPDALPGLPHVKMPEPDTTRKRAYIIKPFKKELDDVYYFGIRQSLIKFGYIVERADEMQFVGGILPAIRNYIENADLIVAEMSALNANVYYELGLAQGMNKRVILITRSLENLPLDFQEMPVIYYQTAQDLVEKMYETLGEFSPD
ncbi:MAG: restriction endonuclease [Gemmatimonadota bacterium]|nr:restriction endonuclease [Gemmatimonadota bacterium]